MWNLTNSVDSPEASSADGAVRPEANPQEVGRREDRSWQRVPTVPPYQRLSLHSAIPNLERNWEGEVSVKRQCLVFVMPYFTKQKPL